MWDFLAQKTVKHRSVPGRRDAEAHRLFICLCDVSLEQHVAFLQRLDCVIHDCAMSAVLNN